MPFKIKIYSLLSCFIHLFPREMMYQVVEDSLDNIGMEGKACLLRAICEMFQVPLVNHGFFGEIIEMFFRYVKFTLFFFFLRLFLYFSLAIFSVCLATK